MVELGLQLYSFEDGTERTLEEKIRLAAKMGYKGVELFGPFNDMDPVVLKGLLDELGMKAISMHISTDLVTSKVEFAKTLGIKYIGIGMEPLFDLEGVYAYAKKLDEIGSVLAEHGLMVTYHNHTQEYAEFNGERIIDVLINNTDSNAVGIELDAGWCAAAGVDPIVFVKENAGRIKLIHIKESSKAVGPQPPMDFSKFEKGEDGRPVIPQEVLDKFKELHEINCAAGAGLVDWKALKAVADEQGCEAYIVEREYSYEGTRVECLEKDIETYKKILA